MRYNSFTFFSIILLVVLAGFLMHDVKTAGFTGSAVVEAPMKKLLIKPKPGVDPEYIKSKVKLRHDFEDKFSAEVPYEELSEIEELADVEELKIYQIAEIQEKGECGNNVCDASEPRTCPEECPKVTKRFCYPAENQLYGQEMVNAPGVPKADIAILDTGVNQWHHDLKFVVKECKDFTKPELEGNCEDEHSHGTHVTGTAAADAGKYGLGILGVVPGAKIHAYKVCDYRGICYDDWIAKAIDFATKKHVKIISMSLGGPEPSSIIEDAIYRAVEGGALVVAAAGNGGSRPNSVLYPAKYPTVVAVSSIDRYKNPSYFSSRGPEVELAAPGSSIYSTYFNGCYSWKSGTSMSTPHVAGVASAVWQGSGDATRNYLRNTAEDIYLPGWDDRTGWGLARII